MTKKIVITGATGAIGRNLCRELIARGDEVTVFTRKAPINPPKGKRQEVGKNIKFVEWNYERMDAWLHELHGVDVIVHLAGTNLGAKRWNEEYKKLCYDSRIISTRNLVEAIKSPDKKPKAFICANAVGIYGDRGDEILTELSSPGNDFLANLCKDWEAEALKAEESGVRSVSLRTGLVMIKNEGVLKKLYLPFKLFAGGPLGNGKQWVPWIHVDDVVQIYLQAIYNESLSGAVNAVSPGIVRMKEFAKTFGKVLKRPSLFPVPKIMMKLAAGEVAEYAVMSQRTSAEKILKLGYKFKFENLEEALKNLLIEDVR
jgi:hypothetical protein